MKKSMYCLVAVVLLSVVSIGVALAGKPAPLNSVFTIDNTARKHVNNLTITAYEALDMFVLYVPNNVNITDVAAPEGWSVTCTDVGYWEIIWTANGPGLSPTFDEAGNAIPDSLSGFMVTVSRRTTSANIFGYVLDDDPFDDEDADSLFSGVSYIQVANTGLTLR